MIAHKDVEKKECTCKQRGDISCWGRGKNLFGNKGSAPSGRIWAGNGVKRKRYHATGLRWAGKKGSVTAPMSGRRGYARRRGLDPALNCDERLIVERRKQGGRENRGAACQNKRGRNPVGRTTFTLQSKSGARRLCSQVSGTARETRGGIGQK